MKAFSTIFSIAFFCFILNLSPSTAKNITLANLTSNQGLKLLGIAEPSNFGGSVKSAGDINGDGIDDIIVGASGSNSPNRTSAGAAYIIYGSQKGFDGLNIKNMTTSQGFKIIGAGAKDYLGTVVSGAGDVNGDGIDDIIVVTNGATLLGRFASGGAYVIFGSRTPISDIDLSLGLNKTQGFVIAGATQNSSLEFSASSAGDVNRDGVTDLVIGAVDPNPQGKLNGTVYVIFGRTDLADIDLDNLTSSQGIKIVSTGFRNGIGLSVSGAGDLNGDGIDDLLIGGNNIAYVVYGSSTGLSKINLSSLNKTQGFNISGPSFGCLGNSVSSAGDVNGDGINDIIIGNLVIPRGKAYIIYGNWNGFDDIDVQNLTSSQGFSIIGAPAYNKFGVSVSGLGDVNGDGIDDIIVGDSYIISTAELIGGRAYVIYGSRTELPNIDLANPLSDAQGYTIVGAYMTDYLGVSVSGAGDFNGDGHNDVLVGANYGNSHRGAAYVIFSAAVQQSTQQQIIV